MREVTKLMINDFKLKKLGYDFMGYTFDKKESLSFHHLIIPRRKCHEYNLGEGYFYWNGCVLRQNTSHDYLHTIEKINYDSFLNITSQIIDMKALGHLDIKNLKMIRDVLESFEKEHCSDKFKNGNYVIKEEYIRGRVKL